MKANKTTAPAKTEPAQPQKKTNSLFGASTTTTTTKPQQNTAPIKQEKISPKKESPTKNQSKPKTQQGKSSIASFFSAKSAPSGVNTSSAIAQATSDIKNIKIKEESSSGSGANVKGKEEKAKQEKVKEEKVEKVADKVVKETKSDSKTNKATSSKDKKSSNKRIHPNTSGELH